MTYERHPISARYPDITGQDWEDFKENIRENGLSPRRIILYEGKILDGWQLYRACQELGLSPAFSQFPKNRDPEAFVETVNEHRRHEGAEQVERRREARKERAAVGKAAGKSNRQIAKEEGVSSTTIQRDVEEAAGTGVPVTPPDGTVTGLDGRKRRAKKPKTLCDRCKRVAPGVGVVGCEGCEALRLRGKLKRSPKNDAQEPPRRTKTTDPLKDNHGNDVPQNLRDAWGDPWIQETYDFISTMFDQFRLKFIPDGLLKRHRKFPWFNLKDFGDACGFVMHYLEALIGHIKENRPSAVCPVCKGKKCVECRSSGMVPRSVYAKMRKSPGVDK